MMNNAAKNFDILAINLNSPHYFDNLIKLFSDLAKFLDISAKPFFPCIYLDLRLIFFLSRIALSQLVN